MPKLKVPLLSLGATGALGKLFSLAKRRGRHIIERKPIPTDAKSPSQLFSRLMFTKCVDLWHLLSDAEKQDWESAARPKHMTGYAWYISQCLRPNPGIYLPLIGGTMQGNIDMATHRLLHLPDPTTPQEPDTRAARSTALLAAINAHAGLPAIHHARYTDAEVDAILAIHAALVTDVHGAGDSILATTLNIATHTAIAAAHHAKYLNSQAVTAAKTVKLDDFATPDDNTDLNASAARHGLFKKLDGVVTHFLNGLGNWVAIAAGKSISTGNYTGDGTTNRQITVGFKCSMVILLGLYSTFRGATMLANHSIITAITGEQFTTMLGLHATNGFVVGKTHSAYFNTNAVVHYYWAISE